jgi:hypothetical protein
MKRLSSTRVSKAAASCMEYGHKRAEALLTNKGPINGRLRSVCFVALAVQNNCRKLPWQATAPAGWDFTLLEGYIYATSTIENFKTTTNRRP